MIGDRHGGRADSLLIGVLFAACYEALRQRTLHGDGNPLLAALAADVVYHRVHALYLPIMQLARGGVALIGFDQATPYEVASHVTCLAGAAAAGLIHLGLRIAGVPRRDAALAAILAGCLPGVVFFATVVELHGLFNAFASVVFVAAIRVALRPDGSRAVVLGAAAALAYAVHASGILLLVPALVGAWSLHRQRRGGVGIRTWVMVASTALATQLAIVFVLPLLLVAIDPTFTTGIGHAVDFARPFVASGRWIPVASAVETMWNECLFAALPLPIVLIRGLFVAEQRARTLGLMLVTTPYLIASHLLLAGYDEHGAYLLPLAPWAAWLAIDCHSRRRVAVFALVAAIASVWSVTAHDDYEATRTFASSVREVSGEAPAGLLVGTPREEEASTVWLQGSRAANLVDLARAWRRDPDGLQSMLPKVDGVIETWLQQGRRVFVTSSVEAIARDDHALGAAMLRDHILPHLHEVWRLRPMESGAFRGLEIVRR